jgi:hypothetical protein
MTEAQDSGRRRRRQGRRSTKPAGTGEGTGSDVAAAGDAGAEVAGSAVNSSVRAGDSESSAGTDRPTSPTGSASSASSASPAGPAASEQPGAKAGSGRRRSRQAGEPSRRAVRDAERGWRDLVGGGSSQLGVSGALRARDVARPDPAELAEAERTVQVVRRQWRPPAAD